MSEAKHIAFKQGLIPHQTRSMSDTLKLALVPFKGRGRFLQKPSFWVPGYLGSLTSAELCTFGTPTRWQDRVGTLFGQSMVRSAEATLALRLHQEEEEAAAGGQLEL